jgi:hypothetical protein
MGATNIDAVRTLAAIRQLVQDVPGEGHDPNAIKFKRLGVQPPGNLYVQQNDQLQVQVTQATASIALNVNVRMLLANGQVVTYTFAPTSASTFTKITTFNQLCEGYILGVSVNVTTGTVLRGQCYVVVGLQRFGNSGAALDTVLVADYVSSTSPLGWPGGSIRSSVDGPGYLVSLAGSAPAAGADATFTVPAGTRLLVSGVAFALTTSAVAGTRLTGVNATDGTNLLWGTIDNGGMTAGGTVQYFVLPGVAQWETRTACTAIGFPNRPVMKAGWQLIAHVNFGDVGDQLSALQIAGEQWIEA